MLWQPGWSPQLVQRRKIAPLTLLAVLDASEILWVLISWSDGVAAGRRCHPERITIMSEDTTAEQLAGVDRLADELLNRADADQAELLGPDGLLTGLTQRVLNRALDAELAQHLGYEKGDPAGRGWGNHRNGSTEKTVLTEAGAVEVTVPRDRNGSFEPQLVPKHARRL